MVQVTFLGTGAAFTTKHRTNIALLVREGDTRLLIECGPTILYQLERVGATADQVDHLFISHRHGDHILGLPMYLLMRARLVRARRQPTSPLTILGNQDVVQVGKDLNYLVFPDLAERLTHLSWVVLPDDQRSSVDLEPGIKLSTLPVPHSPGVTVLAVRLDFQRSGRSLVYSGDTTFDTGLVDFAANCDLLVHEANFSESLQPNVDAESYGHSTAGQAGRIAARANCRSLALVHLDPGYSGQEDTVRADAARQFSGEVLVPDDGTTVCLE